MALAEAGARVVVNSRVSGDVEAVVKEIKKKGGEAVACVESVSTWQGAKHIIQCARDSFGRLDILVNNAGITRDRTLLKMTEEEWDEVIAVHLKGSFACGKFAALEMQDQGKGRIINVTSGAGLMGNFGQTNYVATKAGVIGMTKTWARELGKFGIRVNAVAPGFVKTEIINAMPQKVLDGMVAHTPMGRMGDTADIAEAYVWLASDAASWVTGTTLSVDGGLVIGT